MALRAPAPVATISRRLVAFFLDGLILAPLYVVLAIALDAAFGALVQADPDGTRLVVVAVNPTRVALELTLTLLADAAYYAGCWVRWGMTPGQRLCRVAVRAVSPGVPPSAGAPPPGVPDPERVPAAIATTRWAVLQLLPLCAGILGASGALPAGAVAGITTVWYMFLFFTAAADPLRRGFHDRRAGTLVVRRA